MLQALIDFSANTSPIDFMLIVSQWRLFLQGLVNTALLFVLTSAAGALIAVPLGILRAQNTRFVSPAIGAYTYVFRGTPLLVQTYALYYGVSEFTTVRDSILWIIFRDPWSCAFIAFSLNTAAYVTEIVRGGIQSIPAGEVEAAKASGMTGRVLLTRIILPAAFRRALPMYGNELIFALHGTVVASTITIVDVLGAGRTLNGLYYLAYEGFIAAAVIYATLAGIVTIAFRALERRLNRHLMPRLA